MERKKSRAIDRARLYRYERKFVTTALDRQQVEALVELHPAMFSEIYHPRFVNNVYFDSFSMDAFRSNVAGIQHRVKSRIRWYGDLFGPVEHPKLELKIKNALMGRKETAVLPPFRMDETFSCADLLESLREAEVPEKYQRALADLEPALLNRYRRRYYRSVCGDYRITIDSDLEYYRIQRRGNRFSEKATQDRRVVLELKYDSGKDHDAAWITSHFPFRLTRNSKYVQGVENVSY